MRGVERKKKKKEREERVINEEREKELKKTHLFISVPVLKMK